MTKSLRSYPPVLRAAAVAALIAAFTISAYSNSFHAGYHLDDLHQIVNNHYIRNISNVWRFFTESGVNTSLPSTDFYRPVTTASFALSYAVGGLAVEGFHAFNILVHIANALLVYLIAGRVLSLSNNGSPGMLPLAAALVFALHPVQTGAVTYISGRAVLLAGFFSLAAFYCFMRFREGSGPAAAACGVAVPVLLFTGLMAKETAVVVIGLMAAYDAVFGPPALKRPSKDWLIYVPPVVALAVYLAVKRAMCGNISAINFGGYGVSEYMLSEAKVVVMYTRLMLLPMNQNADYALPLTRTPDLKTAVSAAIMLAGAWGLWRVRRRMPAVTFFGAWFLIGLAPESSIFPINDIAQEYRLYLPSVGFIASAALLADRYLRLPSVKTAAVIALIVLSGMLTFNRNYVYASEYIFWRDAASKSPHSFRANAHLGIELAEAGRYREAITSLEKAVNTKDKWPEPHLLHRAYDNLGTALFNTGMYDRAMEVFAKQLGIFKKDPEAEYNMAAILMVLGKNDDALKHMQNALAYGLDNFDVRYNLALLYERTGRKLDAALQADKALRLAATEAETAEAEGLLARLGDSQ